METNNSINPVLPVFESVEKGNATGLIKTPSKKCSCCGRVLSLDNFRKYAGGYRKQCIDCERKLSGKSEKFKDFTDKELYAELMARGWKGELKKVVEQVLKL